VAVVFDTISVPEPRRLEQWRALTAETLFPMSISTPTPRPFRARLVAHELGSVAISRVTAEPNACLRTTRDIARGDPELLRILVLRHGHTHVEQGDRACTISDGDIVVYDSSRPFAVHAQRTFDLVVCGLPLALLGAHADRMRDLAATRIPGRSPVARMFAGFVQDVAQELGEGRVGGAELELADTLVAFSRALGRGDAPAGEPRLRRIQAWIDRHIADPALTPGRIAAANFVSTRALHRLFEAEGVSVSGWLRARRLEGCRRDLADPGLADRTVAEIARAWGWSDPARFSRRFREAYGCSPTELRAQRQLAGPGAEPELDEHRLDR
jgi:AraC-like DNA-binding protein